MEKRKHPLAFGAQILLAGAGLAVSLEMIAKHVESLYGKGGDTGVCTALAIFSCDTAARSDFSAIAGLPIAALGAAWYAALLVLLPLARFAGRGFARVPDVVFASALAAVAYSLFLLGVSLFTLGKICPLCTAMYAINIALWLVAWRTHPEGPGGAFRSLPRLPLRFETWVSVGLMALGTFGFQSLYAMQAKTRRESSKAVLPAVATTTQVDLTEAPSHGPADAAITVVEFSDFQCPYCRRLADALKEAAEQHGSVRLLFRHNPMDHACNPAVADKFHEFACGAAKATICAERQGKFWEMHDRLFEHQKDLAPAQLTEHATALGLDVGAFTSCMGAAETAERLKRDLERGAALKIEGTPIWYVNGLKYVGARRADEILAIFERTAPGKGKAAP